MQHFLVIFKNSSLAFCHDNKCHYLNAYIIVIHYISVNFNNCHLDSVTFNFVNLKIILLPKNGASKVLNKIILEENWNKWRSMFRKIQTFLSIVDKIAQFKLIFFFISDKATYNSLSTDTFILFFSKENNKNQYLYVHKYKKYRFLFLVKNIKNGCRVHDIWKAIWHENIAPEFKLLIFIHYAVDLYKCIQLNTR